MPKLRTDTFFKHHFKHTHEVRDFLVAFLPKELLDQLELTTLRLVRNGHLLPKNLGHLYTDILWEVKTKTRRGNRLFYAF